jgi:hypothetical protein
MNPFRRRKRDADEQQLEVEINAAREQLARAEAAQLHIDSLKKETERHLAQNSFGDRLFAEMVRTRKRRPA